MQIKISPNMKKIVSIGEDGAILIWDYRKPISDSPPDPNKVTVKSPSSPKWAQTGKKTLIQAAVRRVEIYIYIKVVRASCYVSPVGEKNIKR